MKNFFIQTLLPWLGSVVIRLLYLSYKKVYKLPATFPDQPIIIVFWHGNLLMQPYIYKKIRGEHPVAVMISEHKDGELIASVISHFGFSTVRGSSRRGAAKVLLAAMKKFDEGYDIAITPDGPKGPRFSVADGVAAIAQKKGALIAPFVVTASRFWEASSWDRFMIPKPFCTLTLEVRDPFDVEGLSLEDANARIKSRLSENSLRYENQTSQNDLSIQVTTT